MYSQCAPKQFADYHEARDFFLQHTDRLIEAEKYVCRCIRETLVDFKDEFLDDYNEASYLYPFWGSYPPSDRGNKPTGDQFPWIEVGEHTIGHKAERLMGSRFYIHEVGLPCGSDDRYVLSNSALKDIMGITDGVMVFLDTKSTGPNDNDRDLVLSGYQVSGDGIWDDPCATLVNTPIDARGRKVVKPFQPRLSPIYCLSDGSKLPSIHLFLKVVYKVDPRNNQSGVMHGGQPLDHVTIACLPNGLLTFESPNYHGSNPGLFYPGKDDSKMAPDKRRVRVSIDKLDAIDTWRVTDIRCA